MFPSAVSAKKESVKNRKRRRKKLYLQIIGSWVDNCMIVLGVSSAVLIGVAALGAIGWMVVQFCIVFPIFAFIFIGIGVFFTVPPVFYCWWNNKKMKEQEQLTVS
jgi:uncharacterized membrane protein